MNLNMKKIMKALTVILIIMMAFTVVHPVLAAVTPSTIGTGTDVTDSGMTDFSKKIVGIIRAAGIIISVIMLMVIGIKYMMGSAEEKADYKKSLMPYVVGAVLLLAASTISGFIYNMVTGK